MNRTQAVILIEIDAKQKRLAYIRTEERQLVEELEVLWKEQKQSIAGAQDVNVE